MGKSTFLNRLRQMVGKKALKDKVNSLLLDWAYEYERYPELRVGHDNIESAVVLEVIYQKFVFEELETTNFQRIFFYNLNFFWGLS